MGLLCVCRGRDHDNEMELNNFFPFKSFKSVIGSPLRS